MSMGPQCKPVLAHFVSDYRRYILIRLSSEATSFVQLTVVRTCSNLVQCYWSKLATTVMCKRLIKPTYLAQTNDVRPSVIQTNDIGLPMSLQAFAFERVGSLGNPMTGTRTLYLTVSTGNPAWTHKGQPFHALFYLTWDPEVAIFKATSN